MWISEICELTLRTAIVKVISTDDVTYRLAHYDDDSANPVEGREYPMIVINSSGGFCPANDKKFYDVACSINIITHYNYDKKKTTLIDYEEKVRTKIDAGIKTEFDAVKTANGITNWYYAGLVNVNGSQITMAGKEQIITIDMMFKVCKTS